MRFIRLLDCEVKSKVDAGGAKILADNLVKNVVGAWAVLRKKDV